MTLKRNVEILLVSKIIVVSSVEIFLLLNSFKHYREICKLYDLIFTLLSYNVFHGYTY